MTRAILIAITLVFTVLLTPLAAFSAETKTVVLDVPGMTCNFCPITVRKALQKVPGVIEAKADFETKTATVVFDPAKTNVETLTKATANAGYTSTVHK